MNWRNIAAMSEKSLRLFPHDHLHIQFHTVCMDMSAREDQTLSQALFEAVEIDDARKVSALLKAGADTNAQDDSGMTPAMWALLRGNRESLGVLMAHGLDHAIKDNHGQSIFDYFPRFGVLSNARLANASLVIASLAVEDVMAKEEVAQTLRSRQLTKP